METCTVTKNLEIVPGTRADYELLSQYHYRETHIGPVSAALRRGRPYAAIFVLKHGRSLTETRTCTDRKENLVRVSPFINQRQSVYGVIVYAMPTGGCSTRSAAMPFLAGLDRRTRLNLLNKNVRTISRVIIEPRFRSLGLAVRLVRETMLLMNVRFIEALAVMGQVNPFFEKAGMTRMSSPPSAACVRLVEAFDAIGIGEGGLIDPQLVQEKLDSMLDTRCSKLDFIENEIILFLQCYGKRRLMKPGSERTAFILSKLTDRPVYYLWQNQSIELRI
jgi:hypothetical protein